MLKSKNIMFLSLLSISASLVSCGNNNAPAPFSPEYVENYLETCYGTDFTYTGEFSSDDAALEAYTFKDSSGIETVVRKGSREVVIGAKYSVTDCYECSKFLADEEVRKKLDDSGFEYTFKDWYGIESGIYMSVRSYDDITKATNVLYDIADKCIFTENDKAADFNSGDYKFSGMAMHIELTDAEGDTLYYINVPSVKKGEFPYIKSKPELVTEAQDKYNNNAEMRKSLGRK